ncbi:uncharacterized protein LOC132265148 [Phlebotomus argentipes]|uniref:uncharacterized protein LOC132265148 n=1 Tax=Phlebotomus argentipes TaxID=94469 RepID=UPI002893170C|nr:uncharacterized protein LOC132265148 [Phlebotomus argentipes]
MPVQHLRFCLCCFCRTSLGCKQIENHLEKMPNITVNVTKNRDTVLKTLEESIPEDSLSSLLGSLKAMKESSNAYMTELVNEQIVPETPVQTSKTENNNTEEEDSEEDVTESGGVSAPKKAKT